MISDKLIKPNSIVVVGASNDIQKPGGKLLYNLKNSNFCGNIYVVNPKGKEIQGIKSYNNIGDIPYTDCALIAISAKSCVETIDILANRKGCRGFIIISAGFSELNTEGAEIEKKITEIINNTGGTLIGPNCIGFMNSNYTGTFDSPIPKLNPQGIDLITESGAIAVYTKEQCIKCGLQFNSIWSVGNSPQTGIEDVLEYLDNTYEPNKSSKIKMIYMEGMRNPKKFLKHTKSLTQKGCKIAAIKSGTTPYGCLAAYSHTGALPIDDGQIDKIFEEADIVRCYSRQELVTICSIFMYPEPKGKRIAVITHAGGAGVMLTDVLTQNGFEVPEIKGEKAKELLNKLYKGSTTANPIDFLATGTAEQLGSIINACENDFNNIDAMVVIFGSPGLFPNYDVYRLLNEKMSSCKKPIYPIIPSIINAKEEIEEFVGKMGRINFTDECLFGQALGKVYKKVNKNEDNAIIKRYFRH